MKGVNAGLVLGWLTAAAAVGQTPAPQMGSVVQPLTMPWEQCKARAALVLRAEGYSGLLESGNGWIGSARGTSASLTCIPRSGQTVVVVVTAGGQLVKEAATLFTRLRSDDFADSTAPARDTVPANPESAVPGCSAASHGCSGWSATAELLGVKPGMRLNFWCPPNGGPGPVWGSEVYAAESSVCTAAVHAGTLTFQAGGNAIIELRPGLSSYPAGTRNGVATQTKGSSAGSFVVIGYR